MQIAHHSITMLCVVLAKKIIFCKIICCDLRAATAKRRGAKQQIKIEVVAWQTTYCA
jgi:hypothetical protein